MTGVVSVLDGADVGAGELSGEGELVEAALSEPEAIAGPDG